MLKQDEMDMFYSMGAIPLFGDISRIINVLHYSDPKKRADLKEKLLGRATTLSDAADKKYYGMPHAFLLFVVFLKRLICHFLKRIGF